MGDNSFIPGDLYGVNATYKFDLDDYGAWLSCQVVKNLDDEITEEEKRRIRKEKIESLKD